MMDHMYSMDVDALHKASGKTIFVTETEVDLYYRMALSMHTLILRNNARNETTIMILPVGPVFQYRRFITLLEFHPLDLSSVHFFFMDEYLDGDHLISPESALSFRGFIHRELIHAMPDAMRLNAKQVYFPHPSCPQRYDEQLEELGKIDLCQAGVGIVGHLAFNEPLRTISVHAYKTLPTRIVTLTKETITINAHTAMRGAFEQIPSRAVTVGMKSILKAIRLEIYMNRLWQSSVLRKALMLAPTPGFPVTCAMDHADVCFTITPEVAKLPDMALK